MADRKMVRRTRSTFTPQQKAAALELYVAHGPAETARRTGIKASTLRNWASTAGLRAPENEIAARFNRTTRAPAIEIDVPDSLDLPEVNDELPTDLDDDGIEAQIVKWRKIEDAATEAAYLAILNGDDMKSQRFGTVGGIARDKVAALSQLRKPGAVVNDPAKLATAVLEYLDELRRRHPAPHATGPQSADDEPGPEEG